MSPVGTSSTEPPQLLRYAQMGVDIAQDLLGEAGRLGGALGGFAFSCTEYRVPVDHLPSALRGATGQAAEVDRWVRGVGAAFLRADTVASLISFTTLVRKIGQQWPGVHLWPPLWPFPGVRPGPPLLPRPPAWLVPRPSGPVSPVPISPVPASMPQAQWLTRSPVPWDQVEYINWYGNTKRAHKYASEWYGELQGLHSGLDFVVPVDTPIVSPVDRPGKVIAVNSVVAPCTKDGRNVLVDYGEFLVLYGHTQAEPAAEVGNEILPGGIVANSGIGSGTPHLHMEVIRKDPGTNSGHIRTNPVPFLSSDLRQMLEKKQWDGFYATPDGKWSTPMDQPDIHPGDPRLIP
jgi:hypothetical protein